MLSLCMVKYLQNKKLLVEGRDNTILLYQVVKEILLLIVPTSLDSYFHYLEDHGAGGLFSQCVSIKSGSLSVNQNLFFLPLVFINFI